MLSLVQKLSKNGINSKVYVINCGLIVLRLGALVRDSVNKNSNNSLIDFNGMSTHLVLFNARRLGIVFIAHLYLYLLSRCFWCVFHDYKCKYFSHVNNLFNNDIIFGSDYYYVCDIIF